MSVIERDNPALQGVLPRDYARPALDQWRLGQVIDLISNTRVGGAEAQATDVLGFCKSATLEEVRRQGHVLTPGRYVGAEAARLDTAIAENLESLGFSD